LSFFPSGSLLPPDMTLDLQRIRRERERGATAMTLFLIDATGPFFQTGAGERINWSKAPFSRIERDGALPEDTADAIVRDFRRFVVAAAGMGFTAVTVDDLAHLDPWDGYPAPLRTKLKAYRSLYRRLFAIAEDAGLGVFVTTDVMYLTPELAEACDESRTGYADHLRSVCDALFLEFGPTVQGVIFRIGESDARDVTGDFHSHLTLRTPRQARRFIESLLPVFERHERWMVFRTWSVGIHSIGDLIWNRDTYDACFGSIDSPRFIISMKHGESDFFRFLPVNGLFFRGPHRKIVELQARREYEGFGLYPSFIGRDYEALRRDLAGADNLVGACIWCQTGGWGPVFNRTFLEPSSVWNEINTYAALRIFKEGWTADQAVREFAIERLGLARWDRLLQLLDLSDRVVKGLLYIDDFARRKIFFRRLRVPPQLSVFWDHVIINHSMRKILRCFVFDGDEKIRQGREALAAIDEMIALAEELGLPADGLRVQRSVFELLAVAREYYFHPFHPELAERLLAMKAERERDPDHPYRYEIDFARFRMRRSRLRMIIRVLLRNQRGYRIIDRILAIRLLGLLYPLAIRLNRRLVPEFAHKQAMGIDSLFR
jgi:hypothetical protein